MMTNEDEYNKRRDEITSALKSSNLCALIGVGLAGVSLFTKTNEQITIIVIMTAIALLVVWATTKTVLEKLSVYISETRTREQYLSGELKRYHTYIEKKEKRKFVNL